MAVKYVSQRGHLACRSMHFFRSDRSLKLLISNPLRLTIKNGSSRPRQRSRSEYRFGNISRVYGLSLRLCLCRSYVELSASIIGSDMNDSLSCHGIAYHRTESRMTKLNDSIQGDSASWTFGCGEREIETFRYCAMQAHHMQNVWKRGIV